MAGRGEPEQTYGVSAKGDWLLVADRANSRLLGWHYNQCETGAIVQRLAGQTDFQAKGDNRWQPSMRDNLCWPYAVIASGETVLVCDSGNNRAVLWQLVEEVNE